MNLMINGESHEFENEITLPLLLERLELSHKPVVIELNQKALAPSEFESQTLADDDQLEIITIAAGG